jgi:hypothetical protein
MMARARRALSGARPPTMVIARRSERRDLLPGRDLLTSTAIWLEDRVRVRRRGNAQSTCAALCSRARATPRDYPSTMPPQAPEPSRSRLSFR